MAHYKVPTSAGPVEFDDPNPKLSKEEIVQKTQQAIATKRKPPIQRAFQGTESPVSPGMQKFAERMTRPGRVLRAAGVGIEDALPSLRSGQDMGLPQAWERAKAAYQPGFQPKPGEKMGQFIAGLGDPLNLAASAVVPGGSFIKAALGTGAIAGGTSLLDQMAQGKMNKASAIKDALMGTVIGGQAHVIGKGPATFVRDAEEIFHGTAGIPKEATTILKQDKSLDMELKKSAEEIANTVREKGENVRSALAAVVGNAKAWWDSAAKQVGVKQNAYERARSKPIPGHKIPDILEGTQKTTGLKTIVDMVSKMDPNKPETKKAAVNVLKTLLHIRSSIGDAINPRAGVPPTYSVQASGLAELRGEVNDMIAKLPGGKILRSADSISSAAKEIHGKLSDKMVHPGKAIDFLRKTFQMESEEARHDFMSLLALEKVSGKPVVNELFKALTVSHFAPALSGNQISRSIGGASPFLISAMMRVLGLPFQFSLPASAAGVTAMRSPYLGAKLLRSAQSAAIPMNRLSKPSAVGLLQTLRMDRQKKDANTRPLK